MNKDRLIFRGKRIDTGEWAIGEIHKSRANGMYYIFVNNGDENDGSYHIDISTLGQAIGLRDKNGNQLVFDGDIIQCDDGWIGVVRWSEKDLQWIVANLHETSHLDLCEFTTQDNKRLYSRNDIIGNIHDDNCPELLKGELQ